MEILNYFKTENKEHWLAKIKACGWPAGQYLSELLESGKWKTMVGGDGTVLLLTEGKELVAFCTLAVYDEIQPTDLTPWIGWVFTFPQYRGHRYAGRLMAHAEALAKTHGAKSVYISTDHVGLYEKYGHRFRGMMQSMFGESSRVYEKEL